MHVDSTGFIMTHDLWHRGMTVNYLITRLHSDIILFDSRGLSLPIGLLHSWNFDVRWTVCLLNVVCVCKWEKTTASTVSENGKSKKTAIHWTKMCGPKISKQLEEQRG